jgi:hypothetical protein
MSWGNEDGWQHGRRHPFSHHHWLATSDRALKSTGKPKKATPKGDPDLFPVLLTALVVLAGLAQSLELDIASLFSGRFTPYR